MANSVPDGVIFPHNSIIDFKGIISVKLVGKLSNTDNDIIIVFNCLNGKEVYFLFESCRRSDANPYFLQVDEILESKNNYVKGPTLSEEEMNGLKMIRIFDNEEHRAFQILFNIMGQHLRTYHSDFNPFLFAKMPGIISNAPDKPSNGNLFGFADIENLLDGYIETFDLAPVNTVPHGQILVSPEFDTAIMYRESNECEHAKFSEVSKIPDSNGIHKFIGNHLYGPDILDTEENAFFIPRKFDNPDYNVFKALYNRLGDILYRNKKNFSPKEVKDNTLADLLKKEIVELENKLDLLKKTLEAVQK